MKSQQSIWKQLIHICRIELSSSTSLLNLRQDMLFIYKKVGFNPLHHLLVERGGILGFNHTQGKITDMWTLMENLRLDVETAFFVGKHYNVFFCKTKVTIFGTCWVGLFSLYSILGQIWHYCSLKTTHICSMLFHSLL